MNGSPSAAVRRWLFGPLDTAPIAALRIACGLLVIGWTVSLLPDVHTFLADDGLTSSAVKGTRGWWTVDLVSPWAAVLLLLGAAVAVLVGWHTRIATVLVWLLLIAVQRRDVYVLNSGDLLLRDLAFYLSLMPAGEVWSLDARRRGSSSPRAPWGLRLLQVQLSLVYFFSVVAKLHGDTWQDGSAVGRAVQLADLQRFVVPQSVATSVTASALLTYGTIVIEGALVFGLWLPRFRWYAMAAGVSIHLGIEATLLIGWFSLTVISCYLAFVPPETMRTAVAVVRARVRREPAAPVPVPEPPPPVAPVPVVAAASPVAAPAAATVVVPPSSASSYWVGSHVQQPEPDRSPPAESPAVEPAAVEQVVEPAPEVAPEPEEPAVAAAPPPEERPAHDPAAPEEGSPPGRPWGTP